MAIGLYDPNLGRFLQMDAIEGGSCNDYDYVCGDPINGMDIGGTEAWWNRDLSWIQYLSVDDATFIGELADLISDNLPDVDSSALWVMRDLTSDSGFVAMGGRGSGCLASARECERLDDQSRSAPCSPAGHGHTGNCPRNYCDSAATDVFGMGTGVGGLLIKGAGWFSLIFTGAVLYACHNFQT
jgi:hypothetical protein